MHKIQVWLFLSVLLLGSGVWLWAQQTASAAGDATVPTLVQFSGVLTNSNGKPLTGLTGVTFSLFAAPEGGAPLWLETQNVQPDKAGNYSVMLGSTTSQGLPSSLFVSGQARWLGVRPQGQAEQPRVMLVSVPYALKAGDAQTIGGLPPSAFVLAAPSAGSAGSGSTAGGSANPAAGNVTGSGTPNYVPLWTSSSAIGNSVVYQSGTGSKAKIGINTTKPAATLDVKGGSTVRGLFSLPAAGTATATQGYDSQPMEMTASAYNSGTGTAVSQNFQWQAEAVSNDTTSATGTLNLQFAAGSNKLAETGLNIASNGQINFAAGQAFPGTIGGVTAGAGLSGGGNSGDVTLSVANNGITNTMLQNSSLTVNPGSGMTGGGKISLGGSASLGLQNCGAGQVLEFLSGAWTCTNPAVGTITGVTAGSGLTGGGNSGNVSLSVANSAVTNGMLQNPALTVNAGTGLTGGGTVALGQSTTLNVDTTKVPLLGANNSFTGNQNVSVNTISAGISATNLYTWSGSGSIPVAISGYSNGGPSGTSTGVYGTAPGPSTEGQTFTESECQTLYGLFGYAPCAFGIWGDAAYQNNIPFGLLGTSDVGFAVAGLNNAAAGDLTSTAWFENDETSGGAPTGGWVLWITGYAVGDLGDTGCFFDDLGDYYCTGTKSAVVPVENGSRKVALYAMEAPENWFEDFGSGQLSDGSAEITLEPTFVQTVNTTVDYHVFLTPNGDSHGLYVLAKTPTSFEVREQGGGTSNISFDYRIVARRKGYENIRLADKTEMLKAPMVRRAIRREERPERPRSDPAAAPRSGSELRAVKAQMPMVQQ